MLTSALPVAEPGLRAPRGWAGAGVGGYTCRRGFPWSPCVAAGGPAGTAEPPQGGRERASGPRLAPGGGPGVLRGLCPVPGRRDHF